MHSEQRLTQGTNNQVLLVITRDSRQRLGYNPKGCSRKETDQITLRVQSHTSTELQCLELGLDIRALLTSMCFITSVPHWEKAMLCNRKDCDVEASDVGFRSAFLSHELFNPRVIP